MPTRLRQILGLLLSLSGLAVLGLTLVLYERYSRFERSGALPPIETWELTGFLWFGKWPIVGACAALGILLVVASATDGDSEPDAGPSLMGGAIPGNTTSPKSPFTESWTAATSPSGPGSGRLLGS